jgi:hypothetical protein
VSNGEGTGAGSEAQQLASAQAELKAAQDEMSKIKGEMDTLKTAKDGLERKLDDADTELLSEAYLKFKDEAGRGKPAGGKGVGDEIDLDRASNAEVVAHIAEKYKADLEAASKELGGRLDKTEERIGLAFAQIDVALTAMKHQDFEANKDAIYKVSKDNPTWGAEKCYGQWKMESDKATKEKADAAAKKAEEDRKALTEKGEGVPGSTTQEKELSKEEAASAAYDKAFGTSEKA